MGEKPNIYGRRSVFALLSYRFDLLLSNSGCYYTFLAIPIFM